MTQQKHDILKEHLKKWMLANTDTYDAFEKLMNEQSDEGYQQIMFAITTVFPKSKNSLRRKYKAKTAMTFQVSKTFYPKNKLEINFLNNSILGKKKSIFRQCFPGFISVEVLRIWLSAVKNY